jgi:hypothetical protein
MENQQRNVSQENEVRSGAQSECRVCEEYQPGDLARHEDEMLEQREAQFADDFFLGGGAC